MQKCVWNILLILFISKFCVIVHLWKLNLSVMCLIIYLRKNLFLFSNVISGNRAFSVLGSVPTERQIKLMKTILLTLDQINEEIKFIWSIILLEKILNLTICEKEIFNEIIYVPMYAQMAHIFQAFRILEMEHEFLNSAEKQKFLNHLNYAKKKKFFNLISFLPFISTNFYANTSRNQS